MHLFQARQLKVKTHQCRLLSFDNQLWEIKSSAKCGPKTKHTVKHFSYLSSSEMIKIVQCSFLAAVFIKFWTDFSKPNYSSIFSGHCLLQSSSIPYTEGYFKYTTANIYFAFPSKCISTFGPQLRCKKIPLGAKSN